jgi:hypothetical protein
MAFPTKKLSVLIAEADPTDSDGEISKIDFAFSNTPPPTHSGAPSPLKIFLSAMPAQNPQEDSWEGVSEDVDEYLDRNRQALSAEMSTFQRFVNLKLTVDILGEDSTSNFIDFLEKVKDQDCCKGSDKVNFSLILHSNLSCK